MCIGGCDDGTCEGCADTGPSSMDAGGSDTGTPSGDAGGTTDAGGSSTCPPGEPMPEPFDCTTADPGITFGDPITADPMTWTWVGFDDAVCMNGSSTGIGVNLNPTSRNVMIVLEGGGACFDPISCAGTANGDGYGQTKLMRDSTGILTRGIFDRSDSGNPVADWSFVYVPYCTGDVHGGTNPRGIGGRRFLGYQNFSWYLSRLAPTFMGHDQVLLAGRSAGGLGTIVNYPQTANAFGCTPVHVLNDAGGILPDEYMRPCLQTVVREAWNLSAAVPSDCAHCTCDDGGGLVNVLAYAARRYPDRRFAFLSTLHDTTMRQFYGYGYSPRCNFPQAMPAGDYEAGLLAARELTAADTNFNTFLVPGSDHTFTYQTLSRASAAGTRLDTWLSQMLDGDPGWTDVGP